MNLIIGLVELDGVRILRTFSRGQSTFGSRHVIDADAGVKGPKGVDQAALPPSPWQVTLCGQLLTNPTKALDKLASAASVILAGKKLQEVPLPSWAFGLVADGF